jgi:A/G-specific adenine glycosylase
MLILQDEQQRVLLLHRPPSGIWGGLWSLPECPEQDDIPTWCRQSLGLAIQNWTEQPALRHTFSHFHLDITPVLAHVLPAQDMAMEADARVWYNTAQPEALGLPAPVKTLLESIK